MKHKHLWKNDELMESGAVIMVSGKIVTGVGGTKKIQSSSELLKRFQECHTKA